MAKSWIVPGKQGPVKITVKGGSGGADASSLATKVAAWSRTAALRPVVLSMFEEVSGRRVDTLRAPDDFVQKTVVPAVEKAFQAGKLVIESAAEEQEQEKEKTPDWDVPSPRGKLKLVLGNKPGAKGDRLYDAERLVDFWLASSFAFGTLSVMLAGLGIQGAGSMPKDKLRKKLLELIGRGDILQFRGETKGTASTGAGGGGSSGSGGSNKQNTGSPGTVTTKSVPQTGPKNPPPDSSKSQADKPKPLSWIRIQLVDEDGKALDDEQFEIKLTDGKSPKGKWPKGQAEQFFDQIPEGTCTVKFPKLKDNGWKAPGKK